MALTISWLLGFLISKYFFDMVEVFQMGPIFLIFGVITALGAIFLFFVLPETKGKSMLEIQRMLGRKENLMFSLLETHSIQ